MKKLAVVLAFAAAVGGLIFGGAGEKTADFAPPIGFAATSTNL